MKWEAKPYVELAILHGYDVEFKEPETTWWLKNDIPEMVKKNSHGIGLEIINRMGDRWEYDFTVENVLAS